MAYEATNSTLQTVAPAANVIFTETKIRDCRGYVTHRDGSGLFTLKGMQPRARYRVTFGGNVAVPEGGTVGPVSFALSLNGEPLEDTTMIVTPTAAEAFFNVFREVTVDVPCACCVTLAVRNTTATAADVVNPIINVSRVA